MLPPRSCLVGPALLLGAAAAPLAAAAKNVPQRTRVRASSGERQRLLSQPNDDCAAAEAASSPLPYLSMGSTVQAFPDFDAASCGADADALGVWYSYTPTEDTILKASVDSEQLGVRMYTGACGALVCNAEFATEVEFIAVADVEYKLLVSSPTGTSFTFTLEDVSTLAPTTSKAPVTASPTSAYQTYADGDDDAVTPVPSPTLGASPSWRYQGNYDTQRQDNSTKIPTYAPTAAGGGGGTAPSPSDSDEEETSMDCKSSKAKSTKSSSKSTKVFKTGKGGNSMSHSAKSEKSSMSYGAKSEKSMSYSKGGKGSKCGSYDYGDPMGKSAKGSSKGGKGVDGKTSKEGSGEDALGLNSLLRYGDLNGAGRRWSCGGVWAMLGLAVWVACSR